MSQVSLNPFFTPTQIPGCAFWLDSTDINGNGINPPNGTRIRLWVDKSGNGRDFVQANVANAPTYGNFLSRPGLFFTSASNTLLSNSYIQTGSGGRNTFIVFYDVSTTANTYGNPVLMFMATGNPSALGDWRAAFDGANNYLGVDSRAAAYIYRTTPNVTSMRTVRAIAMWGYPTAAPYNTSFVFGNGTQFTTLVNSFAATGQLNVQNSGVTSFGGTPAGGGYVTSVISEAIYYASDLTVSQRQQVEGYLAWKWGLQSSLPETHPYRISLLPPLLNPPLSFARPAQNPVFINWQPVFLPNCQLWLDGLDPNGNGTAVADGATVSTWVDKSPNGFNATTSSSANPPTYSATSNCLQFRSASTQSLTINQGFGNRLVGSKFSVFIVGRRLATDYQGFLTGEGLGTNTNLLIGLTGTSYSPGYYNGPVATVTVPAYTTNDPVYIMGFDSLTSQVQAVINGGTPGTGIAGDLVSYPGPSIGRRYGGTASQTYHSVDVFEMVAYVTALTTVQRQQVEGYLAWKWGLQGNLPANHPYRSVAPTRNNIPIAPVVRASLVSWLPPNISGLQLWLDAADSNGNGTILSDGATVSTWVDKSGTGRTLTATTSGTGTIRFSTYGGRASILFNSTNANPAYMRVVSNVNLTNLAVFAVYLCRTALGNQNGLLAVPLSSFEYSSQDGFGQFIDANQDRFYGSGNATNNLVTNPVTAGVEAIPLRMNSWINTSGGLLSSWVNGNAGSVNASGSARTSTATGFGIGFDINGAAGTPANLITISQFSEFVVYNTAITTAERQNVEGYLAWKWGLVGNLPDSHPFKRWPPPPG